MFVAPSKRRSGPREHAHSRAHAEGRGSRGRSCWRWRSRSRRRDRRSRAFGADPRPIRRVGAPLAARLDELAVRDMRADREHQTSGRRLARDHDGWLDEPVAVDRTRSAAASTNSSATSGTIAAAPSPPGSSSLPKRAGNEASAARSSLESASSLAPRVETRSDARSMSSTSASVTIAGDVTGRPPIAVRPRRICPTVATRRAMTSGASSTNAGSGAPVTWSSFATCGARGGRGRESGCASCRAYVHAASADSIAARCAVAEARCAVGARRKPCHDHVEQRAVDGSVPRGCLVGRSRTRPLARAQRRNLRSRRLRRRGASLSPRPRRSTPRDRAPGASSIRGLAPASRARSSRRGIGLRRGAYRCPRVPARRRRRRGAARVRSPRDAGGGRQSRRWRCASDHRASRSASVASSTSSAGARSSEGPHTNARSREMRDHDVVDGGVDVALGRCARAASRCAHAGATSRRRPSLPAGQLALARRGGAVRSRATPARETSRDCAAPRGSCEATVVDGRAEQRARLRTVVRDDARDLLRRRRDARLRRRRQRSVAGEAARHRHDATRQAVGLRRSRRRPPLLGRQARLELGREEQSSSRTRGPRRRPRRARVRTRRERRTRARRSSRRRARAARAHPCRMHPYRGVPRRGERGWGARLGGAIEEDAVAARGARDPPRRARPIRASRLRDGSRATPRRGAARRSCGAPRTVHVDGLPVPLRKRREARRATLLGQRGRRTEHGLREPWLRRQRRGEEREREHGKHRAARRAPDAGAPRVAGRPERRRQRRDDSAISAKAGRARSAGATREELPRYPRRRRRAEVVAKRKKQSLDLTKPVEHPRIPFSGCSFACSFSARSAWSHPGTRSTATTTSRGPRC